MQSKLKPETKSETKQSQEQAQDQAREQPAAMAKEDLDTVAGGAVNDFTFYRADKPKE